jgi:hypothetical protein
MICEIHEKTPCNSCEGPLGTVAIIKPVSDYLKALPVEEPLSTQTNVYVENDMVYVSYYLGSAMSLDPCGKYHTMIASNNSAERCEAFWLSMNTQCEIRGLILESGVGDPTDVFITRPLREVEV